MSVRVVQVDESQKDEPGVEKAVTIIAGQSIETYAKLERVDDLDQKTTEDVVEMEILVPVEDEDADEDEPQYIYNRAVVDMGKASRTKYFKAIAPFADVARILPAEAMTPRPASGAAAARSGALTEWNRRAKAWLKDAGHEVKERGRIPKNLEEIYIRNHPDDPKPE